MKAPGAGAAPAVELDGSDDVVRTYSWGLDLAGLHSGGAGVSPANWVGGFAAHPTSGGFLQAARGISQYARKAARN